MAKITCTEYRRLPHGMNGEVLPIASKPYVTQTLAAPSGTSAQTALPDDDTRFLRICSDVALHVSANATATTADDYYPAGAEIFRAIGKGGRYSYIAG